MKKAGKSIEKYRKIKKMSAVALSKKTKISFTDVKNICSGKKIPTKEQIKLISKALDVPPTVIAFDMLETKDVAENKKAAFKTIAPAVKNIFESLVKDGFDEKKKVKNKITKKK